MHHHNDNQKIAAVEMPLATIERISRRFSSNLLDAIGVEKLARAATLNTTPLYRPGSCASHDFCDSNVFMARALETELNLPPYTLNLTDDQVALWTAAWNLAVKSGFYLDEMIKFQVGVTYTARAAGDSDLVYRYRVVARTAKTLTIEKYGKASRRGVYVGDDGIERCKPDGTFSMCPVIWANRRGEG